MSAWAAICAAFLLGVGSGVWVAHGLPDALMRLLAWTFVSVLTAGIASITRDIDWDDFDTITGYGFLAVVWPIGLPCVLISGAFRWGQEQRAERAARRRLELEEAKQAERLLKQEGVL